MKKIYTIIISVTVLAFCVPNINAQTVHDIIDKHIEAHGGYANWEKVKTLKFTGAFTGFSIQKTFTTIQQKPNLYRSDVGIGKFDVVLAYDGSQGWTLDPWFEVNFPRVLNASEENVVLQKAEICSPFLNYKEKGHQVELLPKQMIDGIEMYELKLTRKNGKVENWFLNADTYLEYKQTSMWDDFGYPSKQETYFDDFRTVEGLVLPFYIDRSYSIRNRITEVEKVEINTHVDETLFEFPVSKQMSELAMLEGNWGVVVKGFSRRGWYRTDSTTTTILKDKNKLSAQLAYQNYFAFKMDMLWLYNSKTQSYNLNVYNHFSSSISVLEGEFSNDTLSFNNTNVSFKENDNKVYRQINFTDMQNDSFVLESAQSSDKGKTWHANTKFFFTRIE